jgi:hypothetical protein
MFCYTLIVAGNQKVKLANHPSRNNPNSPLFVSLHKQSMGRRQLTISGLECIYRYYRKEFFPKLLEDPAVPMEDKMKIQNNLLTKPFLHYLRRHSSLTEKARKLKTRTLEQHAGWVPGSNMQKRYTSSPHRLYNDYISICKSAIRLLHIGYIMIIFQ